MCVVLHTFSGIYVWNFTHLASIARITTSLAITVTRSHMGKQRYWWGFDGHRRRRVVGGGQYARVGQTPGL